MSWFAVLVSLVVASAIGGKHLFNTPPVAPATASAILSFASTLAGFLIAYSPLSSNYTNYCQPNVSRYKIQIIEKAKDFVASWKIFLPSYAGHLLILPIVCINLIFYYLQLTNSCLSDFNPISWSRSRCCRILHVSGWEQGYVGGNVGGYLDL